MLPQEYTKTRVELVRVLLVEWKESDLREGRVIRPSSLRRFSCRGKEIARSSCLPGISLTRMIPMTRFFMTFCCKIQKKRFLRKNLCCAIDDETTISRSR